MNFENAKNKLKEYAQEHILDYYDELNDSQKEALLRQIDETDFSVTSKVDRKSTRLNSSHSGQSRMPSSA